MRQSQANWTTISYNYITENSSYILVVIDNSDYPNIKSPPPPPIIGANFNENLGLTLETLTQFDLSYTYYYMYNGSKIFYYY